MDMDQDPADRGWVGHTDQGWADHMAREWVDPEWAGPV